MKITAERIEQLRNLAQNQKVDACLVQEWEAVAIYDLALQSLRSAIGQSSTAGDVIRWAGETLQSRNRTDSEIALAEAIAKVANGAPVAQERTEDAKDAARYRWMRDKQGWYVCYITGTLQTSFDAKYETLDAAIDAAMNTKTPEGK